MAAILYCVCFQEILLQSKRHVLYKSKRFGWHRASIVYTVFLFILSGKQYFYKTNRECLERENDGEDYHDDSQTHEQFNITVHNLLD